MGRQLSQKGVHVLIPARGGSKRIPNKNMLPIAGATVIERTIKNILNTGMASSVHVSTDSEEIKQLALKAGASVPFTRPAELANDHATTMQVVRHFLDFMKLDSDSLLMVAYPLSCLPTDIVRDFLTEPGDLQRHFRVTVGQLSVPPARLLVRSADDKYSMADPANMDARTQDLPQAYFDAGKLYLSSVDCWKRSQNMLAAKFHGYLLPRRFSIDVDYPEDWSIFKVLTEDLI